jgi:hypothetical protein
MAAMSDQSVYAIKPPDEKWLAMKQVYDACTSAGVPVPKEVDRFFDGESPDPKGVVTDLTGYRSPHPCVSEYREEMRTGWEVDLSKVPEGTKILRFVHSYD